MWPRPPKASESSRSPAIVSSSRPRRVRLRDRRRRPGGGGCDDRGRRRRGLRRRRHDREGQGAPARGVRAVPRRTGAFTYLHLAADEVSRGSWQSGRWSPSPTRPSRARTRGCRCSPRCPRFAGRMAPQVGAAALERSHGGRGVLMGGASGVAPARVVVLGAGMAGERRPDRGRDGGRGDRRRSRRRSAARSIASGTAASRPS